MFSTDSSFLIVFSRQGLDSNTLRFMAKVITKDPIQAQRRFVVSYFLSDDTINIHEPPMRNSGKSIPMSQNNHR